MTRLHPDLKSGCSAQGSVAHGSAVLVPELEQGQGAFLALLSPSNLESITNSILKL